MATTLGTKTGFQCKTHDLSDPRNRNHKSLAIGNHNFEVARFSRRNRSKNRSVAITKIALGQKNRCGSESHPCSRKASGVLMSCQNRVLRNRVSGMFSGNPYDYQNHTRNPPTIAQAVWGTYCTTAKVYGHSCVRKRCFTLMIACCMISSSQSCLLSAHKHDFSAQHRSQ